MVAGPHGAGFSNILFAQQNASVVEFMLKPQLNRAYGHLAASIGLDHWLVPEIATNHQDIYRLNEKNVGALVRLLTHILRTKGLGHFLVDGEVAREEL